jgi:hypothetical protein
MHYIITSKNALKPRPHLYRFNFILFIFFILVFKFYSFPNHELFEHAAIQPSLVIPFSFFMDTKNALQARDPDWLKGHCSPAQ